MLPIAEYQIRALTQDIWSTVLNLHAESIDTMSVHDDAVMMGSVSISGERDATIEIECPHKLVRKLAVALFDKPEETTTHEDMRDTMQEITNIVGGNIKGILPFRLALSLPVVKDTVSENTKDSTRSLVRRVSFRSAGHPFAISVYDV